jgi:hypothetical protein
VVVGSSPTGLTNQNPKPLKRKTLSRSCLTGAQGLDNFLCAFSVRFLRNKSLVRFSIQSRHPAIRWRRIPGGWSEADIIDPRWNSLPSVSHVTQSNRRAELSSVTAKLIVPRCADESVRKA